MKPRIVIQFAVTAKEKRAIQRAAKRCGMSVSEWLRYASERQQDQMEQFDRMRQEVKNSVEREPVRSAAQ